MNTLEYFEAVKVKLNITSDYKLAKALGISRQLASKYATGKSVPGPLVAFRVAEILGDQPWAVLADFERERAENLGNDAEAYEWQDIIKKSAGGLMSILLGLLIFHFPSADAHLRTASSADTSHIVLPKGKGTRRRRRSLKAPELLPV